VNKTCVDEGAIDVKRKLLRMGVIHSSALGVYKPLGRWNDLE